MSASKVEVEIGAKDQASSVFAQIAKSAEGLQKQGELLKTSLESLAGFFVLDKLKETFLGVVESLKQLAERSESVGVAQVALAEFTLAASQAGVGTEQLDKAFTKLNGKIADAGAGGKEAAAQFRALGISVKDSSGNLRSTEDILGDVADKFQGYQDGANKSAIAVALFGKAGAQLIPYLNEGSEGLRKFAGVTEESVKQGKHLDELFDQLKASSQVFKYELAAETIPYIAKLTEAFIAAKNHGDGFFGTLGLLTGQSRGNPGAEIESLTKALREFEKQKEQSDDSSANIEFGTGPVDVDRQIADTKRRIAYLQELQRNEALRNQQNYRNEGERKIAPPPPPNVQGLEFLETLRKQVQKQQEGEISMLRLEAAQKGVRAAAEPYIKVLEAAFNRAEQLKASLLYIDSIEKDRQKVQDAKVQDTQTLQALAFQIKLLGMSKDETEKLVAADNARKQVLQQLAGVESEEAQTTILLNGAKQLSAVLAATETLQLKSRKGALEDQLRTIQDETDDLGKSNAERFRSNALRDLERNKIKEGSAAYDELLPGIESITKALDMQDKLIAQKQLFADLGAAIGDFAAEGVTNIRSLHDAVTSLSNTLQRILSQELISKPIQKGVAGLVDKGLPGFSGGESSIVDGLFKLFGKAANGGPLTVNKPTWVGERGPELVLPRNGGNVIPNHMLGAVAHPQVVNHITITVPGNTDSRTATQIATELDRKLRQARSRNLA